MYPRNLSLDSFLVDEDLLSEVVAKKDLLYKDCIEGRLKSFTIANARKKHQKIRKLAGYFEIKREYDPDAGETKKEMACQLEAGWNYLISSDFDTSNIKPQDIVSVGRLVSKKVLKKHPNSFRLEAIQIGSRAYLAQGIDQIVENMTYLGNQILDPIKKALYFHLEIVHIHPLIDGNGRTARSIEGRLLHDVKMPIPIIKSEDKSNYNRVIEEACLAADGRENGSKILRATSYLLMNISRTLDIIRENGLNRHYSKSHC